MSLIEQENAIHEAFRYLGNDADDIADTLAMEGYLGLRCEEQNCPVGNYLRAKNLISENAIICEDCIEDGDQIIELPEDVKDFVRAFDRKEYPFLIYGWWARFGIAWSAFRNIMEA